MRRFVYLSGFNLKNTTSYYSPHFMLPFLLPLFSFQLLFPLLFWQLPSENTPQFPTKPPSQDAKANKSKTEKKLRKRLEEIKIEGEEKLGMTLRDTSSLQSISLLASVSYNYNGSHRAEIAGDTSRAFYLYQRQLLRNFSRR